MSGVESIPTITQLQKDFLREASEAGRHLGRGAALRAAERRHRVLLLAEDGIRDRAVRGQVDGLADLLGEIKPDWAYAKRLGYSRRLVKIAAENVDRFKETVRLMMPEFYQGSAHRKRRAIHTTGGRR